MYELPWPKRVYKFTFFQAKRRRCLSSSSIFGAGSLYVVPSTIIQMVSRVFKSHAFAGRSYFGTKFANSFDTMPAWSVHRLFPLQGFPTSFGHISPYRCARNFNFVKLKSFCLVELLCIYLQLFSITFLTQFVKKTAIYLFYSLDCLLRFLLLTTCSLILQTSSTIYPFLWLNGQNTVAIRWLSSSTNSLGFIFVKE